MSIALPVLFSTLLAQAPAAGVAVTVEPRVESMRYRFENPSSFDTAELVPHFFEQTYDTDNVWIGARARYRLWTLASETSVSFTPQITGQADDLDTFFQPDGSTIVSGTIGNASLRGLALAQHVVIGGSGALTYGIGYRFRRDAASFHDGTKITRRTPPPTETREIVTTREYVTSHVHQAEWFARWAPDGGRRTSVLVEASPFMLGRLAVELPDKYPGRVLVFQARAAAVGAEAAYTWRPANLAVEVAARASRSFSYSDEAAVRIASMALVVRLATR